MWHGLSILWLAFAVSLDSFGAGTTYGMRKIRIPFLSIVIIACCSGAVIFTSMTVGQWLSSWLSETAASITGALILVSLGLWALVQGISQTGSASSTQEPSVSLQMEEDETKKVQVWTFEVQTIGLVIQILKTPMAADVDRSGTISAAEAFLLGTALSLDAFGAGLGAAMIGLQPGPVAFTIALMSALFLRLGMWIGFRCAGHKWSEALAYLPGIFLILMGLMRFF